MRSAASTERFHSAGFGAAWRDRDEVWDELEKQARSSFPACFLGTAPELQGHPGGPELLSGCRNALLARGEFKAWHQSHKPCTWAGALTRQESTPKTLQPEMLVGPHPNWDALGTVIWELQPCEPQLGKNHG